MVGPVFTLSVLTWPTLIDDTSSVGLKPDKQIYQLESLLGTISESPTPLPNGPTMVQLIVRVSREAGTTFAIDDIQLVEEPFEGELLPRSGSYKIGGRIMKFPIPSEANLTEPHLDLSIRFVDKSSDSTTRQIDVSSFGDDDLILKGAPELPIEFVRFEKQGSSAVIGHYRIQRPVAGWESLPSHLLVDYRFGSLIAEDGVPFWGRVASQPMILPENTATYVSTNQQPWTGADQFVDRPIQFSARQAINVETLGDDDVFGSYLRYRWFAQLLNIEAVEDDGKVVRAIYRLERPASGWPSNLQLDVTNEISPSFVGSYSSTSRIVDADGKRAELLVEPTPQVRITTPQSTQVLSLTTPEFQVEYIIEGDAQILLDSIGDGEVFLRHSGQPGKLVSVLPSEDGRTVSVKFAFDRDLVSAVYQRTVGGGLFSGGRTPSPFVMEECETRPERLSAGSTRQRGTA